MKQALMFFSDFPKKFTSEIEVFLLIFHFFHQQTAFFYLLWDEIWYLLGHARKRHFSFFELSFSLKVSSQIVESPKLWT